MSVCVTQQILYILRALKGHLLFAIREYTCCFDPEWTRVLGRSLPVLGVHVQYIACNEYFWLVFSDPSISILKQKRYGVSLSLLSWLMYISKRDLFLWTFFTDWPTQNEQIFQCSRRIWLIVASTESFVNIASSNENCCGDHVNCYNNMNCYPNTNTFRR